MIYVYKEEYVRKKKIIDWKITPVRMSDELRNKIKLKAIKEGLKVGEYIRRVLKKEID